MPPCGAALPVTKRLAATLALRFVPRDETVAAAPPVRRDPNITAAMWREAAANNKRKDIRLFRIVADAVLFADQFLPRARL